MENDNLKEVVKTSEWMITYLIAAIPIVGIIMVFVWAFGDGTNPNKANWAKALILWALIVIVIYALIAIMFGAALFSVFN